jgi:hypothetical protein
MTSQNHPVLADAILKKRIKLHFKPINPKILLNPSLDLSEETIFP